MTSIKVPTAAISFLISIAYIHKVDVLSYSYNCVFYIGLVVYVNTTIIECMLVFIFTNCQSSQCQSIIRNPGLWFLQLRDILNFEAYPMQSHSHAIHVGSIFRWWHRYTFCIYCIFGIPSTLLHKQWINKTWEVYSYSILFMSSHRSWNRYIKTNPTENERAR